MDKQTGTVKWFSRVKGYGFVNPDDCGKEVFAHYSAIIGEGYRNLYEGERVEYELVDEGKGLQAKNVTRGWDGVATPTYEAFMTKLPSGTLAWGFLPKKDVER